MFNLKVALRTLFRTPFVTIVAILSLGLGVGANAAIFSLFDQMVLRPIPVPDPDGLVNFSSPGPRSGSVSCGDAGSCEDVFSYPMYRDLQEKQTSFTGIAAHREIGVNLSYNRQTLRGSGLVVTGNYFSVLGLNPARGRLIDASDDRVAGQSSVAVLSYRYWRTRFLADSNVVGQPLIVNGVPMTIAGVAPEHFDGTTIGTRVDVFVPITMEELLQPTRKVLDNRRAYWLYLFGRLKPGVAVEQAQAAINQPYSAILHEVEAPLQQRMEAPTLERFVAKKIGLSPGARGQSSTPEQAYIPLLLLLGVTFVVLLSACANIANLLLAKATSRSGEMAVRLSIGASRRHLILQLLGESLILATLGAIFGLFVAQWTLAGIGALLPSEAADLLVFGIDPKMVLFLVAVTVGTGLLFGLFPALHSTRPNLTIALKGQAGQPGGARSAKVFRLVLATTQIMLSMALLAIAGLFLKSLVNISHVDLGIRTDHLVTFGISPEMNGYNHGRSLQLFEQVEDGLRRVAGVTGVSAALVPLLSGDSWGTGVAVDGFKGGPGADNNSSINEVAPDYFKTVGMPLLAGRDFTRTDTEGAPKVAIVNEAFALKFGLGQHAIGTRIGMGRDNTLDTEIVGLAKNAKYSDVKTEMPPLVFTPYRQDDQIGSLVFYATTAGSPESVLSAIGPMMARVDSTLPVEELRTMDQQARANVFQDRFISILAAVFAGLATVLASVGLYGVLAYTVAQRTREIGLRMALGAAPGRIRSMVLKQVALMTLVGGTIGLIVAITAGHYAQSELYGMTGIDAVALTSAALLLVTVAMVAGFIPAYRASKIDPMRALRYE